MADHDITGIARPSTAARLATLQIYTDDWLTGDSFTRVRFAETPDGP
jgi:hypothetical protein